MQQLDPKAVWLFFFHFTLLIISPLLIFSVLSFSVFLGNLSELQRFLQQENIFLVLLNWFWLLIPLILILSFIWAKLTYRFYRYELREDGFRKEHGVIYKRYVTIPYDRIQNVDITRGILDRILGLSGLHIQTAGSSAVFTRSGTRGVGAEGSLPGLSKAVAEQLRDEVIRRARQSRSRDL